MCVQAAGSLGGCLYKRPIRGPENLLGRLCAHQEVEPQTAMSAGLAVDVVSVWPSPPSHRVEWERDFESHPEGLSRGYTPHPRDARVPSGPESSWTSKGHSGAASIFETVRRTKYLESQHRIEGWGVYSSGSAHIFLLVDRFTAWRLFP